MSQNWKRKTINVDTYIWATRSIRWFGVFRQFLLHNEVWTLWSRFDKKQYVKSHFDPEIAD
jgi:hypothetical protein